MPSPIGGTDQPAAYAASNSAGSLYLSPRAMMAHAIRAILLAKATAATLAGRRAINRPSHGCFFVPCFCAYRDRQHHHIHGRECRDPKAAQQEARLLGFDDLGAHRLERIGLVAELGEAIDQGCGIDRAGDEMLKASRERADRFAEQLKTALDELGENLGQEEKQVEKLVAERPIAALACTFAVGIVVGFALRRI